MPTSQSRSQAISALEKNSSQRQAISGNLLITSEHNGSSVTLPAVLLAQYPDKFRLELQDPVGGLIALVVVNGDRFWLYQKERKEINTGPVKKIPFPLLPRSSAEDLVRIFLAKPYIDRIIRSEISDDRSIFEAANSRETVAWASNHEPILWTLEKKGKKQSSAIYEDYEMKSGIRFPTKLKISGVGEDGRYRSALLVWKDWDASVPSEQKLFQIPQPQTFGRKIKVLP